MTTEDRRAAAATSAPRDGRPAPGWQSARSELSIAAVLVAVTTAAGYAWAGPAGAVVVLACAAVIALAVLRSLTEPYRMPASPAQEWQYTGQSVITGFWRKRSMLVDATASGGNYDFELRATLQHLFAARLAERHGVSLYSDPERARELLADTRRNQLWYWLDPEPRTAPDAKSGGIPPRTLAAIIDRLEQL